MKKINQQVWILTILAVGFATCKNADKGSLFEVSGTLTNNTAQKVYLEEMKAGQEQGTIVDSSVIGRDGRYRLKAKAGEAVVYNLRLDRSRFPVASVINDVPGLTLDVKMVQGNNEFSESYEVKGSPVSQAMKDYMNRLGNELSKVFRIYQQMDSLRKAGLPDSSLASLRDEKKLLADSIRTFAREAMGKVSNPALFIFELGYYQETANQYNLSGLDIEEVVGMVDDFAKKFPDHRGLASVKSELDKTYAEINSRMPQWTGKPAPDFSLPDPDGKQVKLSSYHGKFVLVDFWASWCGPCRAENPNVVRVYNKYKDRNFTVLGVSLDRPGEKAKWLEAIRADRLNWTHVSDLKEWQSPVVSQYKITGIPFNVLLDTAGVVIGEGLTGARLEAKLDEVLK